MPKFLHWPFRVILQGLWFACSIIHFYIYAKIQPNVFNLNKNNPLLNQRKRYTYQLTVYKLRVKQVRQKNPVFSPEQKSPLLLCCVKYTFCLADKPAVPYSDMKYNILKLRDNTCWAERQDRFILQQYNGMPRDQPQNCPIFF